MTDNLVTRQVANSVWRVRERYVNLTHIVSSSDTGNSVCSARDTVTNQRVAIKRLDSVSFSQPHFARKAHRELQLLHWCNRARSKSGDSGGVENVVQLLDAFGDFDDSQSSTHLTTMYLVLEWVDNDLNQYLRCCLSQEGDIDLSTDHVKLIFYQILFGISFLHKANIIHRDLRPSNIGVTKDCQVKIMDLGFSRAHADDMTIQICAANYRAPEVMVLPGQYSKPVDVWSAGCVLLELLGIASGVSECYPLFKVDGNNPLIVFPQIFNLLGKPSQQFVDSLPSEQVRQYLGSPAILSKLDDSMKLESRFAACDKEGLDLAKRLMRVESSERITLEEAMMHPFLEMWHDEDELTETPLSPPPTPTERFVSDTDHDHDLGVNHFHRLIADILRHYPLTTDDF